MNKCAEYIAATKKALGNSAMSDQSLANVLGCSQQAVAKAKSKMGDGLALKIGTILQEHGLIEHAGEVLLVAHAERDVDPAVRHVLMEYAGKVVRSAAETADSARELVGAVGHGVKVLAGAVTVSALLAVPAPQVEARPAHVTGPSVPYVKLSNPRQAPWPGKPGDRCPARRAVFWASSMQFIHRHAPAPGETGP